MIELSYKNMVRFEVEDDAAKPMYFLFGIRKCGSSILNNITQAIADVNRFHYVDIAGTFFQCGFPVSVWQRDPGLWHLLRGGNIYAGFRNFPVSLHGDARLLKSKKLLMIRDPRDALVSLYYSAAYSHSVPPSGEARKNILAHRENALASSIDAYALKSAPRLRRTFEDYASLAADETLRLIRYEDTILNKRRLIGELCDFFSWTISDLQTQQILGWADVIPSGERPMEFIRKVVPGDHIQKLAPNTIEKLNTIFEQQLLRYGYI